MDGTNEEKLAVVARIIGDNDTGKKGLEELQYVLDRTVGYTASATVEFDVTLARGLNYYTGAIFEVKATGVQMGSICGGGRYDDLTGIFGLPGVSGIGVSFGADRIYDVMTELNLFPAQTGSQVKILLVNFGASEMDRCVEVARVLRQNGISCEVYPDSSKLKKQFKYADDKGIPYVGAIGSQELTDGTVSLKNMQNGQQQTLSVEQLIAALNN
jgi:histidyl-tRNA synthetase